MPAVPSGKTKKLAHGYPKIKIGNALGGIQNEVIDMRQLPLPELRWAEVAEDVDETVAEHGCAVLTRQSLF